MPLAYDEEQFQLRQLLRSLEAANLRATHTKTGIGAETRLDFNFSSTNWLSDWVHDRYGTEWYKRVAHECMVVLVDTSDKDFADSQLKDFRPELIEFQKRCERASVAKNTIRTPELEKEILGMWTPLGPKLETLKEQGSQRFHEQTKNKGRLAAQANSIKTILRSMAAFVDHTEYLKGTQDASSHTQTGLGAETRVGGRLQDWYRDSFGEKWYWEIEQKCTNLLSITVPEAFKLKADDDFRPNLTAFRDRCNKAYLAPKTKRTPALENEMLSLWNPLLLQLETSRTRMLELEKNATKNRGQLILQYQQIDALLREMAIYVEFCKHT
jgi:hypothetical protein